MPDGQAGTALDPPDDVSAEPARGRRREGRDDDLVDLLVVDGVQGGGDGVGVADVAGRLDPLPLQLGERLLEPLLHARLVGRGDEREVGRGLRWRARGSPPAAARRRSSGWRSRARGLARAGDARSTSTCVTGMSLAAFRARSTSPPRSQLERTAPGCVEMITSSTGAYWCSASRSAWSGSGSTIAPRAAIPASCSRSSVRRRRRSALERRLSS